MKAEGIIVKEIITDKDSSGNTISCNIFCNHLPEGSFIKCSSHSAKTLHKELKTKCMVSTYVICENEKESIILRGNLGVSKSLFQLYMLYRLLTALAQPQLLLFVKLEIMV